jgi:hypothetical protein
MKRHIFVEDGKIVDTHGVPIIINAVDCNYIIKNGGKWGEDCIGLSKEKWATNRTAFLRTTENFEYDRKNFNINNKLSISMWVNFELMSDSGYVLSLGGYNYAGTETININGLYGSIGFFGYANSCEAHIIKPFMLNTWHYVVFLYDMPYENLFVDGVLVSRRKYNHLTFDFEISHFNSSYSSAFVSFMVSAMRYSDIVMRNYIIDPTKIPTSPENHPRKLYIAKDNKVYRME